MSSKNGLTTQKNNISHPVSSIEVGYSVSKSRVFLGQPNVENGHKPDENHVSSTSSSHLSVNFWSGNNFSAFFLASSSFWPQTHLLPSLWSFSEPSMWTK